MIAPLDIPTVATDRLVLRGWSSADLDPLVALLLDADHARFIGVTPSRGEVWRRMAAFVGHWSLRGFGMWALAAKDDGRFVGWCGIWFPEDWPEPEIGWALLPSETGKGYATEAARAARRYAYDDLGWSTVISLIDPLNAASLRVAERLGAVPEGRLDLQGKEVGVFRHPSPHRLSTLNREAQRKPATCP